MKVGDKVRVKKSVTNPYFGWGYITHNSVGIVSNKSIDKIVVNFEEQTEWTAKTEELELVNSKENFEKVLDKFFEIEFESIESIRNRLLDLKS